MEMYAMRWKLLGTDLESIFMDISANSRCVDSETEAPFMAEVRCTPILSSVNHRSFILRCNMPVEGRSREADVALIFKHDTDPVLVAYIPPGTSRQSVMIHINELCKRIAMVIHTTESTSSAVVWAVRIDSHPTAFTPQIDCELWPDVGRLQRILGPSNRFVVSRVVHGDGMDIISSKDSDLLALGLSPVGVNVDKDGYTTAKMMASVSAPMLSITLIPGQFIMYSMYKTPSTKPS